MKLCYIKHTMSLERFSNCFSRPPDSNMPDVRKNKYTSRTIRDETLGNFKTHDMQFVTNCQDIRSLRNWASNTRKAIKQTWFTLHWDSNCASLKEFSFIAGTQDTWDNEKREMRGDDFTSKSRGNMESRYLITLLLKIKYVVLQKMTKKL